MNQQEFDDIVNKVIETVLLRMPEVIGNLIKEQAIVNKLNKKFYSDYPEFKDNLPLVRGILEQLESDNVGVSYDKILEMSVPIIKEKIGLMKSCEVSKKPEIESLDLSASSLGSNGSL